MALVLVIRNLTMGKIEQFCNDNGMQDYLYPKTPPPKDHSKDPSEDPPEDPSEDPPEELLKDPSEDPSKNPPKRQFIEIQVKSIATTNTRPNHEGPIIDKLYGNWLNTVYISLTENTITLRLYPIDYVWDIRINGLKTVSTDGVKTWCEYTKEIENRPLLIT